MKRNLDLRHVIFGAGMSGMLAAIKSREAGHRNVIILEKERSVSGTRRDNRYPGLSCNVPAHAYTYSFAPNAEWSSYLAPGPEIQAYFERVAAYRRHFGDTMARPIFTDFEVMQAQIAA